MTNTMSCKTGNAQSRATFFRHSAVLSLTAVLLRKLPNIKKETADMANKCNSYTRAASLES